MERPGPAAAAAAAGEAERVWTRAEVAVHCGMERACIIIDNLVYDVTPFLEEHPGGAGVLLDNAGRDASQCFRDVGHSELALEWRRSFLAGSVTPAEHRPLPERSAPPEVPPAPLSLRALLDVCAPPAALALLAAALYAYLL